MKFKQFKRWFRINVLKKETLLYKVYFLYNNGITVATIDIVVEAKSKAEAKKEAIKFIESYAIEDTQYKFLKVEYK